jgi:hypothetical protein
MSPASGPDFPAAISIERINIEARSLIGRIIRLKENQHHGKGYGPQERSEEAQKEEAIVI